MTVDDDQLQKAQRADHFDSNFGGLSVCFAELLNSTRETARDWQEGSAFGKILLLFVKLPFRAKTKALTIGSFEGEGKGEGGRGGDETKILSENLR